MTTFAFALFAFLLVFALGLVWWGRSRSRSRAQRRGGDAGATLFVGGGSDGHRDGGERGSDGWGDGGDGGGGDGGGGGGD